MKTSLIWASDEGRLAVVKTLLAGGANLNVRDTYQFSALECASEKGHGGVIEAIVGHGAGVSARRDNGYTALHTAALYDQAGAVDALIEAGADVELKNVDGFTLLATAAWYSSCREILALLQHGAKVDVRDKAGDLPLHQACWGRSEGLEAAVDMLLRWGADETALIGAGQSPADITLDVDKEADAENPSTQDEIDRTRLLLSRAPADRAWRRRDWLVMLRSRVSEATTASRDGDNESGGGSSSSGCDQQGDRSKVARTQSGGGPESGVHGNVGAGSGTGGEGWSGVVNLLLELEVESVFRTVVGFL